MRAAKTLLVSAHPGHELKLHQWMELVRPDVFLITDGSGSAGRPRTESSRRVIDEVGARLLEGSGGLTDQRLYAATLGRDLGFFRALRAQLADLITSNRYDEVICDGLEGYNTAHDWCHYLVHSLTSDLTVRAFEHSLAEASDAWAGEDLRRIFLDDAAIARKRRAAAGYPEIALEVKGSVERWGVRAFNLEVLRPIIHREAPPPPPGEPPHYEVFGERRVREGSYPEVIRWESHMRPLVEGIWHSGFID